MLSVHSLQAAYGASQVLFNVSFEIADGEAITLLGRNGMGKTTTIRTIMGLLPTLGGEIRMNERPITHATPEMVARMGVGLVPEGRQVFPTLSVRENLVATAANRLGRSRPWTLERIYEIFPRLRERANQSAATLSGGEQQMLVIGRALMTNPTLLILDEATEGLAPVIRAEIWSCIKRLKADGQSLLLIDKNIHVMKKLADRHFVLEKGRTVWSGNTADIERDAELVHSYVGI
ncbi:ABC transporter ATP-binding protein [Nitratireductor rhodophyticola]|uniref:ABC transporter ATP-binding protein n=1 Tax=Nitratireductor rhodophyticola TaxID=2854036 RepID=UPI00300AC2A3